MEKISIVLSVLSRLGNLKNYFIPPKLEVNQNFRQFLFLFLILSALSVYEFGI